MKQVIFSLFIGLALLKPPLLYGDSATLTVERAIEIAIRNNPQLQATQARLAVSEAAIVTAGARLNPSLLTDNGVAEKTYRLGVEQTIELGGKRKRRMAVAQAQRDTVKAEINIAILDLRSDVRRTYAHVFNLQERQRTLERVLSVAQELVSIAQTRERAGDISTLDVLQTEILRLNAQNELQSMGVDLVNARNRLNTLLNQPMASTVPLAPPNRTPQLTVPLEPVPATPGTLQGRVMETPMTLDALIAQALSERPEVQQNLSSIEVSTVQASLARASRMPNLSLTAGPDYVAEPGQAEVNVFVVGSLEIPLFNRQQGPIQEAFARKLQLQKEQEALKTRIILEVTHGFNAYRANQERIKRYETELLPLSMAVMEKSRRAFEEGKTSIVTPIQAQQAYMSTRLGYLQALSDLQNAMSDLERAVGTGL